MIGLESPYPYMPSNVRVHYDRNNRPFTTFSVRDLAKGAGCPDKTYQWYNFTVWGEALNIEPGDKIRFTEFTGISTSWYNGRTGTSISCKVTVEKAEAPKYYAPTEDSLPQFPEPKKTQAAAAPTTNMFEGLDEVALPFDL